MRSKCFRVFFVLAFVVCMVMAMAVSASAAVLSPSASGVAVRQNSNAVIDYSNSKDGYVMIKWIGGGDSRIAVQVKGPNNPEMYTYYLRTDGLYDVIPLSDGDGVYQFFLCRNVFGIMYVREFFTCISVELSDSFAPFLRPNQYVNYSADSEVVKKAAELVKDETDTLSKVRVIYNWVVDNLDYDYDKVDYVQSGYIPDVDRILLDKKGICFDYVALMAAMLRSQDVPVKLVIGYTGMGEYHAWLSVWSPVSGWLNGQIYFDGNAWTLMDPTLASTGRWADFTMGYINDVSNYRARFVY